MTVYCARRQQDVNQSLLFIILSDSSMSPAGSDATNAFQPGHQRAIGERTAGQAVFHAGKSFPRDGFIVTNLETEAPKHGVDRNCLATAVYTNPRLAGSHNPNESSIRSIAHRVYRESAGLRSVG